IVAYQRALARAVGSHSAGLLLSQLWYWSERLPAERDGWFWKTQDEIEEETVMTRWEQETARRKLRELGLLEEAKRGVPAKLWFRINRTAVVRLLHDKAASQDVEKPHARMREDRNQGGGESSGKHAESRQPKTKNTPKSTQENTAAAPPAPARQPVK